MLNDKNNPNSPNNPAGKSNNRHKGIYGLIGHPLHHSFSKEVHEAIGQYEYNLFDVEHEEMCDLIRSRKFDGLNVTIPYKQDVIEFCDRLTARAQAIGAVNTLYWENSDKGRILVGHNTDYDGFLYTARRSKIDFFKKTVLILGTGGTSKTVHRVVADQGAKAICFASRHADSSKTISQDARIYSYDDLGKIADIVEIIVNTTPVGTYPNNLKQTIFVKDFPKCSAVIDVIYNPQRTALIMEAEKLGLKTATGLPMIVAQATAAATKFLGNTAKARNDRKDKPRFDMDREILEILQTQKENVVLIGMPGCGKSTFGRNLALLMGRELIDMDEVISKRAGKSISRIFEDDGEAAFRQMEAEMARTYGAMHGLIIATGGGVVITPGNYEALHQNGTIVWLKRPLEALSTHGRPLSQGHGAVKKIADERMKLYEEWADYKLEIPEIDALKRSQV